jgi:hypothetical protein
MCWIPPLGNNVWMAPLTDPFTLSAQSHEYYSHFTLLTNLHWAYYKVTRIFSGRGFPMMTSFRSSAPCRHPTLITMLVTGLRRCGRSWHPLPSSYQVVKQELIHELVKAKLIVLGDVGVIWARSLGCISLIEAKVDAHSDITGLRFLHPHQMDEYVFNNKGTDRGADRDTVMCTLFLEEHGGTVYWDFLYIWIIWMLASYRTTQQRRMHLASPAHHGEAGFGLGGLPVTQTTEAESKGQISNIFEFKIFFSNLYCVLK